MAAYIIANIQVSDPAAYEPYRALAAAAIARYGGRYLSRGGASETLEGGFQPSRLIILEFDSMERAREFYGSPEYQAAIPIRQAASTGWIVLTEGIPPEA